jgi:serine/tyrosine/threonine adenylyltransferase
MQLQASRFETLGPAFYTRLQPTPLPEPYWVGYSAPCAQHLGLPDGWRTHSPHLQAATGNQAYPGASPLASVYSGHQFGVWAGQLGDGRAISLGDLSTPNGLQEIQLKGSGLTPYSRMGDGRAVLRSSIREFLCSEAMHALGIPTTRALCVTGSPAPVRRETIETAAVVTRVSPSFIRFGHFEHFSHSGQHTQLRELADFVIQHFYPSCANEPNPYAALLKQAADRTASLLAQWQAVGFCHGVMNTDNMSILGLTIDYGPFQFMDAFNPGHICNHSDHSGRYAYARQPNVAYWNLFCLGQALMPLIDDTEVAMAALEPYKTLFPTELQRRMNAKLGLTTLLEGDHSLTEDLLQLLAADKVDYTVFWRQLSQNAAEFVHTQKSTSLPCRDHFTQRDAFDTWTQRWLLRLQQDPQPAPEAVQQRMLATNPRVVLRNHLAQEAIAQSQQGQHQEVAQLLAALEHPFDEVPANHPSHAYAQLPPQWAQHIEISCSS